MRENVRGLACSPSRAEKLDWDLLRRLPGFTPAVLEHVAVWTKQMLHPTPFHLTKEQGLPAQERAWPWNANTAWNCSGISCNGVAIAGAYSGGPTEAILISDRSQTTTVHSVIKLTDSLGPADWLPTEQRPSRLNSLSWGTRKLRGSGVTIAGDCTECDEPILDRCLWVSHHSPHLFISWKPSWAPLALAQLPSRAKVLVLGDEDHTLSEKESQLRPDPQNFCSFNLGSDPTPKRGGNSH